MAAKKDRRKADLSKIHILKKELAIEEDSYRLMLIQVTGKNSSAKMNQGERWAVISHMKRLQDRAKGLTAGASAKAGYPGEPHNVENSPQLRKIKALLTVGKRPWSYADALCKQLSQDCSIQYERVAFAPSWLLQKVIASLTYQGKREGWDLK